MALSLLPPIAIWRWRLDQYWPLKYDLTMVMTMVGNMSGRIIKASEFKAKCLKLMDEVAASGETLTVTKNGRPVVELRPAIRPKRGFFGRNRGKIAIHGDLDEVRMEWQLPD